MQNETVPQLSLVDGTALPVVGFGTYKLNGATGVEAIVKALHNGYTLLDSAFNYENEGAVGKAVRESGLPRDSLRVTSKLPGRHHAYDQALRTVEESFYRMGVGAIDLYLIHWPNPKTNLYVEAWRALIEAQKRGLVRSIGVCNFLPAHIDRLLAETGITPAVNQIEMHPYFPQAEQLRYNAAKCIATEAWSPLGRANDLLEQSLLKQIAKAHGRSPGQVVLRWHHQLGAVPIPKAATSERQRENLALFDFALSDAEMDSIATLAQPDGRLANQDPAVYEEF